MSTAETDARRTETRPRFIALDIDGTVLLEDGTFSPGVEDAVAEAVASEHIVTLATGRGWEATHPILVRLGLTPDYVVCANGATIMSRDADDETGYRRHTIETFDPTEVLQFLQQHLPAAHYLIELADGARLFTDYLDDWDLNRPNARRVTLEEMHGQQATRVVVVSPEHDGTTFNDFVEQMGLHQVSYAVGWSAWLDIAPQGVNKSTALARVCEWLGVQTSDVIVMGDGRNDIEMLEWARDGGGVAVAMGQAPDDVQRSATDLTLAVEGGGVAAALTEFGVITAARG